MALRFSITRKRWGDHAMPMRKSKEITAKSTSNVIQAASLFWLERVNLSWHFVFRIKYIAALRYSSSLATFCDSDRGLDIDIGYILPATLGRFKSDNKSYLVLDSVVLNKNQCGPTGNNRKSDLLFRPPRCRTCAWGRWGDRNRLRLPTSRTNIEPWNAFISVSSPNEWNFWKVEKLKALGKRNESNSRPRALHRGQKDQIIY